MTKGSPQEIGDEWWQSLKDNWVNHLCAEHDGSIASFARLNQKLDDLEDYERWLKRDVWNWTKIGKITAACAAGGVVFGPLALAYAPGFAAALGTTGLLGAASTGTAISSLSGAALTSASLYAIGSGSMATGIVYITAGGAALGGYQGSIVSNKYFGDIKDFKIRKIHKGGRTGPYLIFINGFLSQKNENFHDWRKGVQPLFSKNPWYSLGWEAKTKHDIGDLIGKAGGKKAFRAFVKQAAAKGSKKVIKKLNPLTWMSLLSELLSNPWHTAMAKASMTGLLLADLIARTKSVRGFTLMGHSLGARVIYYALNALSTKNTKRKFIKDVYLFGGAVDRTDRSGWERAANAISGNIYNYYSDNDWVLKILYQGANALISKPIGLDDITYNGNNIINIDATDIVDGHMLYKDHLQELLPLAARRKSKKPLGKKICAATTEKGNRCKLPTQTRSKYCHIHKKK